MLSPSLSSGNQPEVHSFLGSVGMKARSGSRISVKSIELLASETSLSKIFLQDKGKKARPRVGVFAFSNE